MSEVAKKTPYQALVDQDFSKFSPTWNPMENGAKYWLEDKGFMPIWGIRFSEKPIKPDPKDMFERTIDIDDELEKLGASRKVKAVRIEREVFTDNQNCESLTERIYIIGKDGKEELDYLLNVLETGSSYSRESGVLYGYYENPNEVGVSNA